mgnify:CR=1 FL=1
MDMSRRSQLSAEQRLEAVLSLLRREEPAGTVARRFGVSEPTLYRWRDQFLEGGKAGLASGSGKADERDRRIAELEHEVAERDRYIGEQAIAIRLLKKTAHSI